MNGKRNLLIVVLAVFLMGLGIPGVSLGQVSVFAECAYTDADVECYIYANTGTDNLISGGVKLSYNPADLELAEVAINENVWYFGDGITNYPYMSPEEVADGVIFIVGKLDTVTPQAGVNGSRVLIGTATFNKLTANMPVITLSLGRTSPYVNFANTAGADLDSAVNFTDTTVAERGDANADGNFNAGDYIAIRNNLGSTDFAPWVDCNNDGAINGGDYICVRNKL